MMGAIGYLTTKLGGGGYNGKDPIILPTLRTRERLDICTLYLRRSGHDGFHLPTQPGHYWLKIGSSSNFMTS